MGISANKDAICEEIERVGYVRVTNEEREMLAKAPTDVLHWIRKYVNCVFERGHVHGARHGDMQPMPPTPEEVAERAVHAGDVPVGFLIAARKLVADAIRDDRTGR